MRLTREEFSAWAEQLQRRPGEKLVWARIAKDAGFRRGTLDVQRTRNQVDAQIIVNLARTRRLDPIAELSRIPRWQHLTAARSTPSQLEIAASLHPAHALRELSDRLLIRSPDYSDFGPWTTYPSRFSTWIDVAGPDNAREIMRNTLGLTAPSLSAKLNSNGEFSVDEVIDGFAAANMDPIYGLVLAGALTPREAGYADSIRQDALLSISDENLLHLSQKQVRYMRRILQEHRIAEEHLRKLR